MDGHIPDPLAAVGEELDQSFQEAMDESDDEVVFANDMLGAGREDQPVIDFDSVECCLITTHQEAMYFLCRLRGLPSLGNCYTFTMKDLRVLPTNGGTLYMDVLLQLGADAFEDIEQEHPHVMWGKDIEEMMELQSKPWTFLDRHKYRFISRTFWVYQKTDTSYMITSTYGFMLYEHEISNVERYRNNVSNRQIGR